MKSNVKIFLISLGIPIAVGGLSALTGGGMGDYLHLIQPPLSPPGWLFPIVWSVLYLLMGYSAYRVHIANAENSQKKKALILYGAQLVVNFLWSPVFFGLGWFWVAFFLLLTLWALIFLTIRAFSAIDEKAGDLLLPYLLWVTFAGYLNLGIALLN